MSDSSPSTSKKREKDPTHTKSWGLLTKSETDFIVNNIGSQLVPLARELGLHPTQVAELEGQENLIQKAHKMITLWSQKNGKNATKEKMIDCLKEIECEDMANTLSNSTGELTRDVLEGFKQQLVELYSNLNVPQPPPIDKDISIDSIFIDQQLEVITLKSPEVPYFLNLEKLIKEIVEHKMLRILVEGYPGFGKTTLASKIATDWAKGSEYIRSHFDLVLLIPLREVGNQHLLDFIVDMINRANQCTTFKSNNIEKYFHQHKVLLILDSYDEMSPEGRKNIHPFFEKKKMNDTCILVTSRRGFFTIKKGATNSSQSLTFQHENVLFDFWNARVFLKGVSKEQRTKMLQDHFEIPSDTLHKTNELLGGRDDDDDDDDDDDGYKDELFRCPLLVFWLGWMLETYGLQDIRTRTCFYKRLVNFILHKTLVRANNIQKDAVLDIFFISTDKATVSVQQQIVEFGDLGIQKMIANDVLFNESDFKSAENSILLTSDFLVSYKSLAKQQEQTIYEPMHRSLLEFLVAFHVCYSNKDINKFKQCISTLMKKGLKPSADSLFYPFTVGLLEHNADWLFKSLSPWSYKYSAFGPEMMSIFQELKAAENDDLLQHLLCFVLDYCDISDLHLNHKFYPSLIKRLLELANEEQLISVMKWVIHRPFPISKMTLDNLYVITGCRNKCYSALDNISIQCKKLICYISDHYDERTCSLKQLLTLCRTINAEEVELRLMKLTSTDCDLIFDEMQKEMKDRRSFRKFQRVNCYYCQLKNKHVNVLTQLVERGCITKGIAFYNNYGIIECSSLSKLWASVMKSSSITEFTFDDKYVVEMFIFKISMPFQLQFLHLKGKFSIELDSQVDCVTSIKNLTLLNVVNVDNVMNALDRFNHVNHFRCEDFLFFRYVINKISFLKTITELHLVLTEYVSDCPPFIQVMPSLTIFTLNVFDMSENITCEDMCIRYETCVISALKNTRNKFSKKKQLKQFGIHFIKSIEVFKFFVNCFIKVESMNLECLELLLTPHENLEDPGFTDPMDELKDLLRNENITQLNLIGILEPRSETKISDFVSNWFSEDQFQIKKRFYYNENQLRLFIPWFYYDEAIHDIVYIELKKNNSVEFIQSIGVGSGDDAGKFDRRRASENFEDKRQKIMKEKIS